jgi:hypothetical protein
MERRGASTYAYHYGGRKELQFNVGFDIANMFRHGVAFSFEPSRSVPNPVQELLPSVARFNEFVRVHPDEFADMSMWEWHRGDRIRSDRLLSPVRGNLVRKGMFVFLGKMQRTDDLDIDIIVEDLGRLLMLYRFVEGDGTFPVISATFGTPQFRAGWSHKKRRASASLAERTVDVDLRHNEIQEHLCEQLAREYGRDNVTDEWVIGTGRIDVVLRRPNGKYWFYEIKTAMSARGCIREALAQVLEYSFWPGAIEPERLFIVGEASLDRESAEYLKLLKQRFSLPIEYRTCMLAATTEHMTSDCGAC